VGLNHLSSLPLSGPPSGGLVYLTMHLHEIIYTLLSESFFHTLKTECIHHMNFKTQEEANQTIFEYIEVFYNRKRLHSTNDYLSPSNYENLMKAA